MTSGPAAVLWDMDGTLVDTEPYWIAREHALVERFGGTWSHEQALQLVGNPLLVSAELLRELGGVPLPAEEVVEVLLDGVRRDVRERVPLLPGAVELLGRLAADGVPCALVTMSYRSLAADVVAALPPGSFATLVTGDEVRHGKPHPEPYLEAARRLGVDPRACVALEDSTTGVASAEAAGCRTVALPRAVDVPAAPGRSRLASLEQLTPAVLERVAAGDVVDLLDPPLDPQLDPVGVTGS